MKTHVWDSMASLAYEADYQGEYTVKDRNILLVDEAFQDLFEVVIQDRSAINTKAFSLIKALNDLLASRLVSFAKRELAPNWHCLIHHAARLLFERIALLEAQLDSECMINTEQELLLASQFSEMGFYLHHFSPQQLGKLQSSLQPILSTLKRKVLEGHSSREKLSENQIPRPIVEELNVIFSQSGLLTSVHAGLGAAVSVSGFSLEISVPKAEWWTSRSPHGQSQPARTAYFHRDETCFVPKALLYLSDVNEDSGPFSICPSSFKQERSPMISAVSRVWQYPYHLASHELNTVQIGEFKQGLPLELRGNSHYGFDVPDDTDTSEAILVDERKFLGNSGTCIVFDGYNLLHRGGLCDVTPRVALQIMLPAQVPSIAKWMNVLSGIRTV